MSMIEKHESSLSERRESTDGSLLIERTRTDEAIALELTLQIEDDLNIRIARGVDDLTIVGTRADWDGVPKDQLPDREYLFALLKKERFMSDRTLSKEREQFDFLLKKERDQNWVLEHKLFLEERTKTDKNLSLERDESDKNMEQLKKTLAQELSSHLKTKDVVVTRDDFLSIVSHDLRNPLSSVLTGVDLFMQETSYSILDDSSKQLIAIIKRCASSALRLTEDLVDVERMNAGKLGLTIDLHEISDVIYHAFETCELSAQVKNISIINDVKNISGFLICDRERIAQVLTNILSNALKFTPENGKIILDAKFEDNQLEISIRDSGPGIPSDMISSIFDRMKQLQKSDQRGLGLGLYISKMIVEAHNGKIWAESTLGVGSTFHLTIPAVLH